MKKENSVFGNIEKQIGFDLIRDYLERNVKSSAGRDKLSNLRFSKNFSLVNKNLLQTKEMQVIRSVGEAFPSIEMDNVLPLLGFVQVSGAVLDAKEIKDIGRCLSIYFQCKGFFFGKKKALYPQLSSLFASIQMSDALHQQIQRTIDEDGEVLDSADRSLGEVRRKLNVSRQKIRSKIQFVLDKSIKDGYTDKDMLPTIINGRMVMPVKAEAKRIMPGLVHDESSSGNTVYFEPTGLVDANNEVKELILQEKRIIHKVLSKISKDISGNAEEISQVYDKLGDLDVIQAKGSLAIKMKAELPLFSEKPVLNIVEGRNPNLVLKGADVIPMDVKLNSGETRFLVISGPNAGGKSVALKTVGLFVYMLQCGLLVPLDKESEVGMFKKIFVDIGDQQSVEDELSTYSAHLKNMYFMVNKADEDTLLLIDEMGGGTAPEYGGAVAEVVLGKLINARCFGIVTTHFSNLKNLAEQSRGIDNASMLYDFESLTPLYALEIGKPGHSYALELVQKTGFSTSIIDEMKNKVSKEIRDFDEITKKLENEFVQYHQKRIEAETKQRIADKLIQEYRELKESLEGSKKEYVRQGKAEAREIVKTANKKIENAIATIKSTQADKASTKEVRAEIDSLRKDVAETETIIKPKVSKKEVVAVGPISIGDVVKVVSTGAKGELLKMRGNKADVQVGNFIMSVKVDELIKLGGKPKKPVTKARSNYASVEEGVAFSQEIDIRGYRADEAIKTVESYIDKCVMFDAETVRIIHGKGDGILRNVVRQTLNEFRQVSSFKDEHPEFGGAGVTVVQF